MFESLNFAPDSAAAPSNRFDLRFERKVAIPGFIAIATKTCASEPGSGQG